VFDPTVAPLLIKKPVDLTPQIAKRAYELYEERVRGVQDWEKAEREIRKDEPQK
jgi:H+-transporting ATPase